MKRALASFRRRMFDQGLGTEQPLHRVTYRVAPAGVLGEALKELERAERARVEADLAGRVEQEVGKVVQMIKTRQQEIRERLKEIARELRTLDIDQLPLDFGPDWDRLEAEQLRQDVRLLQQRQKQLDEEIRTEPELIRERYRLKSLNAFPLGLELLLPETAVRRGSLE